MKYEHLRKTLRTGDIVLFSGRGFISWIIKKVSGSQYSHVGMIVKNSQYDVVQLYESTTLSKLSGRKGVQLVSLRDRLISYKGTATVRQLVTEREDWMDRKLLEFMAKHRNKPYERNLWQLFCSAYDSVFGRNKEDMSSIFCSEMIAAIYKLWELLPQRMPANEYTPADFSQEGTEVDLQLRFSDRPACLGEGIVIELPRNKK